MRLILIHWALCGVVAAYLGAPLARPATRRACTPRLQSFADPDDDAGAGGGAPDEESMSDESERSEVEAFRAQMMRQMMGGGAPSAADAGGAEPKVVQSATLAAGQVLVANPERFCSRNPFSRPVRDLGRFGLQGPIDDDELSPDMKAQMLPVLLLIEHGKGGSRALLMERRTGALMGDVSMDEYGCVAISPLWLGGTAKQNSLYVVHNVPGFDGATTVSDGLFMGGWAEARPKVADSSLADSRFKFFLGATEWGAGQLEDEVRAGAWLTLDCDPALVIKDRVAGWRPGRPKPVWTELMNCLDTEEASRLVGQVYPESDDE